MVNESALERVLWRDTLELIASPRADSLSALARLFADTFAVDHCSIYVLEARTDELVLRGSSSGEHVRGGRLRVGQGITGLAAFHKKILQVPFMQRDPRTVLLSGQEPIYSSIIAIPFEDDSELCGVLNLQCVAERRFTPEEIEVLEASRRLILTLFHAVQTHESMRRRSDEVQALNELGQAMNSGLGLDESLELIASLAADALHAKGAAVRLLVEDGSLALATVLTQPEASFDPNYEKRISEYVAATGEPIMIDDVRVPEDPMVLGASMVCVPLVLEDRIVGTLSLFDKIVPLGTERRLFSISDLNMLFALSSQIAAEIEDIRLTGKLQELVRSEKQQGARLRELYIRSQALLQSISDGLMAIDRNGIVEEINSVGARILGRSIAADERVLADDLIEDKPPLREWLSEGGQFSSRVITLNAQMGPVAVMANLQPIMDGGQRTIGAVLTFRAMGEVGRLVNRVIGVQRTFSFDDILGTSSVMEKTKELARIAAGTSSNILIQGETGTGKEVFAQAIHNASAFSEGPFLAVNCAALPRDLIESELFGYVEGAFTGASKKGRLGKFELASGGTIFLDEIGEMPPEVQVKLLRVLQEKTIVRVGGDRTIPIDCRLIAATNRDLHSEVSEQRFRRDLLYRLNVITIEVPPLRERQDDIPLFIERFLHAFAERNGKIVSDVSADVMGELSRYSWPGNVRELENVIEHAVALVKERIITREDLPLHFRQAMEVEDPEEGRDSAFDLAQKGYEEAVRHLYLEALRVEGGDVVRAANLLGVSRATLYRRLKEHDLLGEVLVLRLSSHN